MVANAAAASRNAWVRATKSVSVLSSAIAPRVPATTRPTRPSAATRSTFSAAFEISMARRRSTAASRSPCVSAIAFLQAITPAPVLSLSALTRVTSMLAMSTAGYLSLKIGVDELEQRSSHGDAACNDYLQTGALFVVDRVDAQGIVSFRPAFDRGHQCARHTAGGIEVDGLNLHDARNLDMTMKRLALGPCRRRGVPRQRLQILACNPILLADSDRPEPAVADVVPHRPHVQAEE